MAITTTTTVLAHARLMTNLRSTLGIAPPFTEMVFLVIGVA